MNTDWMVPDWPAPSRVRAVSTTRNGGISPPPYASLNLGLGTADDIARVVRNRKQLCARLGLTKEPFWLSQVHGNQVVAASAAQACCDADASYTRETGLACVVLTADCLPVVFCDRQGTVVAAAHAGWRGLAAGVLEATVAAMGVQPKEMLVWLGPAIGPSAFEVGDEVREIFVGNDSYATICFEATANGRWLANLAELARQRLRALGVLSIHGGDWCTFAESKRFFSHRRDQGHTGRMASLIWLDFAVTGAIEANSETP